MAPEELEAIPLPEPVESPMEKVGFLNFLEYSKFFREHFKISIFQYSKMAKSTREWDRGKGQYMSWIQSQRETRDDDFKPPESYKY